MGLDINRFWVWLITFYQRFISPYKGFHCAHHASYRRGTCSNAVKDLIEDNGFIKALPLIRGRFKECRLAYEAIQANRFRSDLPCIDISCDGDLFNCGGKSGGCAGDVLDSSCDCFGFIRELIDWKKRSKKAKGLIVLSVILLIVFLAYLFDGRKISSVVITDLGVQNQSVLKRFTQREHPQVRVLLVVDEKKIYSEIVKLEQINKAYKLSLDRSLKNFKIDQLQILDARLSVAQELFVVGQELEVFENPQQSGQGQRFKYQLKRRWHF